MKYLCKQWFWEYTLHSVELLFRKLFTSKRYLMTKYISQQVYSMKSLNQKMSIPQVLLLIISFWSSLSLLPSCSFPEVTIQEAVQQDDPIKEQAAPENQVFKAFRPRNSTASHSHTPTPNVVSSPFLPFSSAECQNKITLLLQNIESSQIWLYEERKLENIYSNFSQPGKSQSDLILNMQHIWDALLLPTWRVKLS